MLPDPPIRRINAVFLATAIAGVLSGSTFDKPIPNEIVWATMAFGLSIPLLGIIQMLIELREQNWTLSNHRIEQLSSIGIMGVMIGLYWTVGYISPLTAILMLASLLTLFGALFAVRAIDRRKAKRLSVDSEHSSKS